MRRDLLMLVVMILWSLWMIISAKKFKVDDSRSIAGIRKSPGVAMEFARRPQEVVDLLGDPDAHDRAAAQAAHDNRQAMKRQQYLDFVFIVLYWMVFVFAIAAAMRQAVPWLGGLLVALISAAAVADVLEDIGILGAVGAFHCPFWPFPFGVTKWLMFFAALGLSSLLFLFYPRFGTFPSSFPGWADWPRLVVGATFLAGSAVGIAAVAGAVRGHGSLFALAQLALLVGFIALLILFVAGAAVTRFTSVP
jgi:hypothetical protein